MSSSSKMNDKLKGGGDPRERYEMLTKIGKGAYGYVCKALDTHTNTLVAIKIINLEDAGDEVEDVHQEISVMSNINCPQLTKYFASYVYGANLWIIMEYLEAGSLLDIIKECGPLSEPFVAYIMRELLSALAYLHSERKIHRDVKAGNILVAANGSVKLADFGVTGQLTDSIDKRQTKIGTPFWMAPEVISQSAYDGCADVWSAGITAIELSKGAPPYANRIHPFQAILLIPKNPAPVLEGSFSEEFKDFVACCLVKAPNSRPSAATLLRHPFLTAVEGIPPAWSSFIHSKVEEQRSKATMMSTDDTGDLQLAGFEDTGDWNFTMRTGMSYSNSAPNSRSHSRSNSRLGSFSQPPDGAATAGAPGVTLPASNSIASSSNNNNNHNNNNNNNNNPAAPSLASRSQSKHFADLDNNSYSYHNNGNSSNSIKEKPTPLEGFRSTSADTDNSVEDLLSDPDAITPNSARSATTFFGPAFDGPTTASPAAAGIGFPSTYPSKSRGDSGVPVLNMGSITSAPPPPAVSGLKSVIVKSLQSPDNSLSPRHGAPPRPKSITLSETVTPLSLRAASQDGGHQQSPRDLQRTVSQQEDRLSNLQEELQALRAENALLKNIAAPYLHTLELLAKHREACKKLPSSKAGQGQGQGHSKAAHAASAPTHGTALASIDSFTSISASIQQIVYADDADVDALQERSDALVRSLNALTSAVPSGASPACKSIVAPALNQLRHRVQRSSESNLNNNSNTNNTSTASASASAATDASRRALRLDAQDGLVESANHILSVLTVALAALDTTDPYNPLQKAARQATSQTAAAIAREEEEEISLSAPTPKATHTSRLNSHSGDEETTTTAHTSSNTSSNTTVEGVSSLDLLVLLTAYLKDDLDQPDNRGATSTSTKRK